MNTSVRARHGARGFSFVELLVTIIIAAIIFAAMVPVFVMATQKNSSDSLRLQAANVAQDKIEKIRQLAYGAIVADAVHPTTTPNLYNPAFADAQFGPETTLTTGSGVRRIHTDYVVTLYPAASTGLASQYKVVTVTAYWDAPPAPVKRVVLQTIVYRQYAGPPITDFSTVPFIEDDGVLGLVGSERDNLASVTLSAHVDLLSGVTLASVQFKVSAYGGQTIASKLVRVGDLNSGAGYWYDRFGTFYWTWDCTYAANTVYDLQATAFSSDDFAGNTAHQYPRIQHTQLLAPPGAVKATPGNATVALSWAASPSVGIVSYEIARAESAAGPWVWTPLLATVPATQLTYTDTASVVNLTTYYYAVRAVTSSDKSTLSVSNAVTPMASADGTGPTAPGWVTATAAGAASTITLAWGAATDPGSPSTGVLRYEIYRSADGFNWSASPLTVWTNLVNLSYPDAGAGWAKQWYYRIRAVDGALNPGLWSLTVNATTVARQFHNLTISVDTPGNHGCNVWVLESATSHYYDKAGADKGTSPPTGTPIADRGSVTFTGLPDGAYVVYAGNSSTPGNKTYGVDVQAPSGLLTGVKP